MALRDLGRPDEAADACRQAIRLLPNHAAAHNNLGNALAESGRVSAAADAYLRAIELQPGFVEAENNLGTCRERQGRLDDAIACYRRALAARPGYRAAHDNLLVALQYHQDTDPAELLEEHRRWYRRHAEPLAATIRPHDNDRDPERRLRVGYVSPDFRQHPIPFFVEPILASHDRKQVAVHCYVDLVRPDAVTERLHGRADVWRDVTGLSDDRVADIIRRDAIDILVDLAVHAPHNRLLVFARKPAPVQVSYLGYANTTGLPAIDYRLTDAHVDPPGRTDAYQPEELVRLPDTFCCYQPPADAPDVGDPPALASGRITFASLNRLPKLNPVVLSLWARVLAAVPGSRLLLQANGLADRDTREHLVSRFGRQGIDPDRLELLGWGTFADYLANLRRTDIGLDTFPFNGHTTSCHALWMGVPFVTFAGRLPVSRVGGTLLSYLGLHELVAETADAYVEIAARLAGDLGRLHTLRIKMRERMQTSPLLDAKRFARVVEDAYREMWRRWCGAASVADTSRFETVGPG
jgi:predicted O-linked N-acetylglucosamine transferase (SPINDLY family)